MKLADDSFKLQSHEIAGFYARAFRAIGQGQCARSRLEAKAPHSGWANLRELLNRDVTSLTAENKTQSVTFDRTYTPDDIFRLDESAGRRSQIKKIPDIRSLEELLRTVGRLIDEENGRLIRILRDQRCVSFDYDRRDGTKCSQQITSMELYKLQQKYYELRGKKTMTDLWNSQFSSS